MVQSPRERQSPRPGRRDARAGRRLLVHDRRRGAVRASGSRRRAGPQHARPRRRDAARLDLLRSPEPASVHDLQGTAHRGSARSDRRRRSARRWSRSKISASTNIRASTSSALPARRWPISARPPRTGREHHYAAAGPSQLPDAGQDLHAQAAGSAARGAHRDGVHEGSDPRAVSQQGLFRLRLLRRRSRRARLLRQARGRPQRGRGGDACRAREGAVELRADRQSRARPQAPDGRAAGDARDGRHR